jgi:hypothetical protein
MPNALIMNKRRRLKPPAASIDQIKILQAKLSFGAREPRAEPVKTNSKTIKPPLTPKSDIIAGESCSLRAMRSLNRGQP